MIRKSLWGTVVLAGCFLAACDGADETRAASRRLVVEGYVDSGGFPDVNLSWSMVPDADGGDISESVARWAVVTISDGEREVTLTGGPAEGRFPPYHYYTYEMEGEPGKTYTLRAEYRGCRVEASAYLHEATPIERIEVEPVAGVDTLRHLSVLFTAPADVPAYYHLSARVLGTDGRSYPCMVGAHEVTAAGEPVTLPVYRSARVTADDSDYAADFPVGALVTVTLARLDRGAYEFWHAFDNASLVAGSVFVGAPGSLPSNVAGGLGVWSARGACTLPVRVE